MASVETKTGGRVGAARTGVTSPAEDDGADGSRSGRRLGTTAPSHVPGSAVDPDPGRSARRPGAVTTAAVPVPAVDGDGGRSANKTAPKATPAPVTRSRRATA